MSIETAERQDTAAVAPEQPMLEVKDLVVRYGRGRKAAAVPAAVDGVSFSILPGETVGLVGESGSGKSTIGKAILGLQKSAGGTITYQGEDITHAGAAKRRALGGELRAVFQDPNSSLNPRQTVGASLRNRSASAELPPRRHGRRPKPCWNVWACPAKPWTGIPASSPAASASASRWRAP